MCKIPCAWTQQSYSYPSLIVPSNFANQFHRNMLKFTYDYLIWYFFFLKTSELFDDRLTHWILWGTPFDWHNLELPFISNFTAGFWLDCRWSGFIFLIKRKEIIFFKSRLFNVSNWAVYQQHYFLCNLIIHKKNHWW